MGKAEYYFVYTKVNGVKTKIVKKYTPEYVRYLEGLHLGCRYVKVEDMIRSNGWKSSSKEFHRHHRFEDKDPGFGFNIHW